MKFIEKLVNLYETWSQSEPKNMVRGSFAVVRTECLFDYALEASRVHISLSLKSCHASSLQCIRMHRIE